MDRYNERLIKAKAGAVSFIPLIASILLVVASLPLLVFSPPLGVLILAIGIFLIIFTKDMIDIEYEFIITNGDIEISKIYAKKRRKTITTIEADSVACMDSAESDTVKNDISIGRIKPKFYVGTGDDGSRVIVYTGEGDNKSCVVLDLDEKCIDHLKQVYKNKSRI